jgi:hypothetical protein
MWEAAHAAAALGDAETAFAAAALAVGASGGADLTPLTSLCRAGVAAPGGHGGFAVGLTIRVSGFRVPQGVGFRM